MPLVRSENREPNLSRNLFLSFVGVREQSENLVKPMSVEDQCIQAMADTSPTKWHLAHTTWFFETFILKPNFSTYKLFNPDFNFLFNSYYEQIGQRHARDMRGLLSRPSLDEVNAYRFHVDEAMKTILQSQLSDEQVFVIKLGLNHEQQHQELILTDIKYTLSCNPINLVLFAPKPRKAYPHYDIQWHTFEGGLVDVGSNNDDFIFDCEGPQHKEWLEPYQIASRPITNGEFSEFINDGGYQRPELWLSDGWSYCQKHGWQKPLYWDVKDESLQLFTLSGIRPINANTPVCHISYYEADAYARWAGCRLPTEAEWENVATTQKISGNFVESTTYHPLPAQKEGLTQLYGDIWEWTASPYTPYPGFEPARTAIGEYNGKFMSGQMVLRGGSCVTPKNHIRPTYRNFFYPPDRWQFSGLRLARDVK